MTGTPPRCVVRVVVMCCHGASQDYLVARAAEEFELVGVVRHIPRPSQTLGSRLTKYLDPRRLFEYLVARLVLPAHERRAQRLERELLWRDGQPPRPPAGVPAIEVEDINSPNTRNFLRGQRPDLVLINGTNLLRRELLRSRRDIRWGFVNLHTGLSPYSRGGNCNLFMMLEGKPELTGITVHHLDAGIDRGDIIVSDQLPLREDDNFEMAEVRCFHHGVERLLEGARAVCEGKAERVPQWEPGKLFLRRTGYVYRPWHRVLVNRMIRRGLIRDYLRERTERSRAVRLVGVTGR